jgi:cytochrome c-type biogenesis protein CcmE
MRGLVSFVRQNRWWVLVPALAVGVIVILLVVAAASESAPLVYTLF